MKNLRNKNQPPPETAIQTYLSSSWDKVLAVYAKLAEIETLADTITAGDLDGFLSETDIDTIAKLNAILTDATLGDFASQAEAEAGVSNTKTMTPLRVAQAIAVLAAGIQNNFNGAGPPTATDDADAGYAAGSIWIDTVAIPNESYRCADPTPTAAVWLKTTLTADELALVALSGSSDDLVEGVVKLLMTVAERDKLALIEPSATADQTPAEIEAGYNSQVAVVTQPEAEAGTSTDVKRWTPQRVAQAVAALASGGLAWSSANSSIAVVKNTGTVFYALGATVTATLPAAPSVGDSLMIVNNDSNALYAYNVNVTAGGSNEIRQQNVIMIPQATVVQGETALLVCYDAGATKRWHMQKWVSSFDVGGAGGMTPVFKSANYTAAANEKVFCLTATAAAAFTITLPASPSSGEAVSVWDVEDAAGDYNVTIARNGNTIGGAAEDFVLNVSGGRVDLAYDGTTWQYSYTTPGASGFTGVETFIFRAKDFNLSGTTPLLVSAGGNYPVAALAYDQTAYEAAWLPLPMPLRWDEGQFRFRVTWQPTNTNTGVVQWGVYGNATTDGAVMPTASVGRSVDDAASGITNAWQRTAWSSWFSMDNTPSLSEIIAFRMQRNGGAGADTYTADANFIALELQWRSEAPTDD